MYEITPAACLLRDGHALAPVLHAKAPIMDATSLSELGESCSATAVDLDSFALFFNNNVGQYVIEGAIPCQSTITIEGVTDPYTFTCSGGPGNFQTAVPQLCCSFLFIETIFPGGTSDASPSTTLLSIAYANVRSIAEQFGVSGLMSSSTTSSIGSAETVTTVQSANDQNNMNGLADQFRINVNSFIDSGGVVCGATITVVGQDGASFIFQCNSGRISNVTAQPGIGISPPGLEDILQTLVDEARSSIPALDNTPITTPNGDGVFQNVNQRLGGVMQVDLNQFVDLFNSRVDTYVVGGSVPCGSSITISGVDDPFVFTCVGGPGRLDVSVSSLCCAGLVVTTTFPDGQDTANTGFLDTELETLVNNAVANGLSGIVNEVIHNQAAASQSGINALSVFFNNNFFTYIRPASHAGISSELLIETYDQLVEQATFFSDPPATALLTSAVNPPSGFSDKAVVTQVASDQASAVVSQVEEDRASAVVSQVAKDRASSGCSPCPSNNHELSDLIAKAELTCNNNITFAGPISSTNLEVSTTYFHCGDGPIPEFAIPELSSVIPSPELCCSPPPPPPPRLPPPPPPPSSFSLLVVVDSTGGARRRRSLRRFLLAREPDEGAIFDSLQSILDEFYNDTDLLMLDFNFSRGKPTGVLPNGEYRLERLREGADRTSPNSDVLTFIAEGSEEEVDGLGRYVAMRILELVEKSKVVCNSVITLIGAVDPFTMQVHNGKFACQSQNSTMDTASFSVPSLCCEPEPTPALRITSTVRSPDFTLSVTQVISATTVLVNQVRQENVTLPDGTVTTPFLGFPAANDTSTGISSVLVAVTADTLQGRDALAGKFQDSILSYILSAGISGVGHCGGTVRLRNSEDEAPFVIFQCLRDPLIPGYENITVRLFQLCCRVIGGAGFSRPPSPFPPPSPSPPQLPSQPFTPPPPEDTCDYEALMFYGCDNRPNQMHVKLAGNAQTMSQVDPDGDSSLRFGHWAAPSLCYEKFLLTGASTGTKVTTYVPAQGLCSHPTDVFRPAGRSYTYAAITDKLCDHCERQRLEVIILD
eukprot:gene1691-33088_t